MLRTLHVEETNDGSGCFQIVQSVDRPRIIDALAVPPWESRPGVNLQVRVLVPASHYGHPVALQLGDRPRNDGFAALVAEDRLTVVVAPDLETAFVKSP